MKHIKTRLQRLWADESGQGTMEYLLMLTVVVVIIIAFKEPIKNIIADRTKEMGEQLKGAMSQ